MTDIKKYDVIIIGGGPAGATCALRLRHSGLQVLLIDKAAFPRQKICGDAVAGRSIKTLFACCPEVIDNFRQFPAKTRTTKSRVHVNNQKPFDIHWVNEVYCCMRYDFDNFLINAVRQYAPNVTILEDFPIDFVKKTTLTGVSGSNQEESVRVGNQAKQVFFDTKMLVGCDGAQSVVTKNMTSTKMSPEDHAGAVRAYFKGVKGLETNTTEVFYSSAFSPGYLWVFPLSEGVANVGFGMQTAKISEKRVNLRTSLSDFIQQTPVLRGRFEGSEQLGKVEGFGLPLGSRRVPMSGDNFLLAGDAASLIDPASGAGISNAISSGKVAAEIIEKAYKTQNFTADFLKEYETRVFKIINKELVIGTLLMRISVKMPFLILIGAFLMNISVNRFLKRFI